MSLATEIRAIRKANGLTQIQMAGLCRRQSKTLSKYETGAKKRPDAAWLRWYVKIFGKGRKYPSIDAYLRSRTIKTATADELAYLYHSQELNLREIGELYACHHGTVRRYMLRLNVPTLKTRRKSPFRWRVEYQGTDCAIKTLSEIQSVWGVNRSTVHKQILKYGAFCNGRLKITRNEPLTQKRGQNDDPLHTDKAEESV